MAEQPSSPSKKRKIEAEHSTEDAKRRAIDPGTGLTDRSQSSNSLSHPSTPSDKNISEDTLLELALSESWLEFSSLLHDASRLTLPPLLKGSRVSHGVHQGKNLLSLLAYHKKWKELDSVISIYDLNDTVEQPIDSSEGRDFDPGKNFLWMLAANGQWYLLQKLLAKPEELSNEAIANQAQQGFGQGTNMLWHLAFWNREAEIIILIRHKKIDNNALSSRAKTGIAQGKNVLGLLAEHRQWRLIEHFIDHDILNHSSLITHSKFILRLAQLKRWPLIEKLINKGLVTSDALAERENGENVLLHAAKGNYLPVIYLLLEKELITAEQLTAVEYEKSGSIPRNVLELIIDNNKDNSALVSKFLDIKPNKKALMVDEPGDGIEAPERLVAYSQFSNFEKLIDLDLLSYDMLRHSYTVPNLVYRQQWNIIKKLIGKDLLLADLIGWHSNCDQPLSEGEYSADILWMLAKHQQWDLIADLVKKKQITSAVLKKPPVNGKTFWDFLDIPSIDNDEARDTDEDEAIAGSGDNKKKGILEALIQQDLLDSEILRIKLGTKKDRSLFSMVFPMFFNRVSTRALLISQITTQLLLEPFWITTRNEYHSSQFLRSFLTDILLSDQTRLLEVISLLLAAPLQPLAGVPWQSFKLLTPRLMTWCWQQRDQNNLFEQLIALGVSRPSNAELGNLLSGKEQVAWLQQGGPEISLENFPHAEQFFIPEGFPFGGLVEFLQRMNKLPLMRQVIDQPNKTVSDLPKIALLKFCGPEALKFLNEYRFSLPSFAAVAPYMSESCVCSWLFQGDLNLFEEYFLADLEAGAPLPSQEVIQHLWPDELTPERRTKVKELYKKYASSSQLTIEKLGPAITDFSSSAQDLYWQEQIQKKLSDLFINFAFRAADMQAYAATQSSEFSKTIMNIIFSYLLLDAEPIIPHYLLKNGRRALPSTVDAMSQAYKFKKGYQKLIFLANRDAQYLYARTTPRHSTELLAVLGHKSNRAIVRESSTTASDWKATKTGSNSAFHAIFGLWDEESREYVCKNISLLRQGLDKPEKILSPLATHSYQPFRWVLKNRVKISGYFFTTLHKAYEKWEQSIETAWLKLEKLLKENPQAMDYLETHWHLPKAYSKWDDRPKLREIMTKLQEQGLLQQKIPFEKILNSDRNLRSSFIDYVKLLAVDFLNPREVGYYHVMDYLLELIHLDRNILPQELFFIAYHYGLHIICHLPGAETLVFNERSGDVVEIWYDGRHFLREPKPDSLHLYQTPSLPKVLPVPSQPLPATLPPDIPGKDEKSSSARAWKPTVADGDCAFHAIFGQGNGRFYYCIDARDKRGKLAKAIADSFPVASSSSSQASKDEHKAESIVYRLSITGITALIMDQDRPLTGRLQGLRMIYRHWCEQRNELDVAWAALEIALKENPQALNFLATQHTLEQLSGLTESQVLRAQLQNICQRPIVTGLQEIISQDSALHSSYQAYQRQQNLDQDFDWRAAISIDTLQEYADIISQPGRYLLPTEVEIIAYVFNRKIIFYPQVDATPQIFNDEGSPAVEVWFDGINHFEREPEVQAISAKSKKTKRAREETAAVTGRGKLAKTTAASGTTPAKSLDSALVKTSPEKPPLPQKDYADLLDLIMSGKEQEAVKIIHEHSINYANLLNIASNDPKISDYFPLFAFLANFVRAGEIQQLFSATSSAAADIKKIFQDNSALLFRLAKNKLWGLIIYIVPAASFLIDPLSMRTFTALLLEAEISPAVLGIWQAIAVTFGDPVKRAAAFDFDPNPQKLTSGLDLALLEVGDFQTCIFLTQKTKILTPSSFLAINEVLFQTSPEDAREFFASELFSIYRQIHEAASSSQPSAAALSGSGLFASHGSSTPAGSATYISGIELSRAR